MIITIFDELIKNKDDENKVDMNDQRTTKLDGHTRMRQLKVSCQEENN